MGISGHGLSEIRFYRCRFNAGVFVQHVNECYAPAMDSAGIDVLMMDNDRRTTRDWPRQQSRQRN